MNSKVPHGASLLLDFIGGIEAPRGYDTVYGNNQGKLPKPLTSMSLDEVIVAQASWSKRFGSSAAGRYQFMRATLKRLIPAMGLNEGQKMTPDLQDSMGYQLLKDRGYLDYVSGAMSLRAFALALSKEWASLPVLVAMQGAKGRVTRGQSYYAGDKLNKSLVKPSDLEAVLSQVASSSAVAPVRPEEDTEDEAPVPRERDERPAPETQVFPDAVTVARVQQQLYDLGYTEVGSKRTDGTFDGAMGKLTRGAIAIFRLEHDLPVGDTIDDDFLTALSKAGPREMAQARAEATTQEVAEKIPEVKTSLLSRAWAWWIGGGAGAVGIASGAGEADPDKKGILKQVFSIIETVPPWMWCLLVVIGAGVIVYLNHKGAKEGVQAFRDGARR